MDSLLAITSSPHFRSKTTTRHIMTDVCVALIPALLASMYIFGLRSLLVTAVCVLACCLFPL